MRRKAEQEMNYLCDKQNYLCKLVKFLKKEGQDVNSGQYLRGINDKFAFREKDWKRVWKEHMEKTINKENAWDQNNGIGII